MGVLTGSHHLMDHPGLVVLYTPTLFCPVFPSSPRPTRRFLTHHLLEEEVLCWRPKAGVGCHIGVCWNTP